jgi:two-component sensor histidine kinase
MSGEQVFLAPKFALVFGLLIHELATNAAKYGALSVHSGQISIHWTLVETNLAIEWRETGRPIVAAPTHKGFGTRLLSRALGQFGGSAELNFDPSGLICTMNVSIPADNLPSPRSVVSLQMIQRA